MPQGTALGFFVIQVDISPNGSANSAIFVSPEDFDDINGI